MKKRLLSALALGATFALGLVACGGGEGSPGQQAPTSYQISLRADRTNLPVNIGGEGPGIGTHAPYTTTMYVSATERGRPVPEGTSFSCDLVSGLESAWLYYLDGVDNEPKRAIVLQSNAGSASFHLHARDKVGNAEVRCAVTDKAGITDVDTVTVRIGSGGPGHAGRPASVVYRAYSVDPRNPNVYQNPGNPNAPGIGYLGVRGNQYNIPNSLGLQAIVRDELGQPVADPQRANVQVRILRNNDSNTSDGATLLGNPGGPVVQARTNNGVADFRVASGVNRGALLLEMTVDRFDNDVTNGIQEPIRQLLSVPVVNGISEERLRIKRLDPIRLTIGEPMDPVALEVEGGTLPFTWKDLSEPKPSTSRFPDSILLSSTGIVTGTPTEAPGVFTPIVKVTDRFDAEDTGVLTVILELAPLTIDLAGFPESMACGESFTHVVRATGGLAPYTWSLIGVDKNGELAGPGDRGKMTVDKGKMTVKIDNDGVVTVKAPECESGPEDKADTYRFVIKVADKYEDASGNNSVATENVAVTVNHPKEP